MADTTAYRYVENVNAPWDTTAKVVVERGDNGEVTKEIVKGGDPVELTDEQRELLSNYVVLRKASDKQVEEAGSTDGKPSGSAPTPANEGQGGAVTLTKDKGAGARS
jgi:hypothetical protein